MDLESGRLKRKASFLYSGNSRDAVVIRVITIWENYSLPGVTIGLPGRLLLRTVFLFQGSRLLRNTMGKEIFVFLRL